MQFPTWICHSAQFRSCNCIILFLETYLSILSVFFIGFKRGSQVFLLSDFQSIDCLVEESFHTNWNPSHTVPLTHNLNPSFPVSLSNVLRCTMRGAMALGCLQFTVSSLWQRGEKGSCLSFHCYAGGGKTNRLRIQCPHSRLSLCWPDLCLWQHDSPFLSRSTTITPFS